MVNYTLIIIALLFHLLDLVSGVVQAIKNKELCSSKMRDGIFKKIGFLICYALAILIDVGGPELGITTGGALLPTVVGACILVEITSITENIAKIYPELKTKSILQFFQIGEKEESNADKK